MNRIREIRKTKGITIERLAAILDISPRQVVNLESGQRRLTTDWMKKIAAVLDVSPTDLMSFEDRGLTQRETVLLQLFNKMSPQQKDAYLHMGLRWLNQPKPPQKPQ